MDNSPRLTAAERRYLATHPACVATRRRAEDAADAFLGSFGRPDDGAREAAIEVLSTAGLDIAKAEQEALDAFRAVPLERRLADLETELAELRRALG